MIAVVKAERCCPLSKGPILPVPQRHPRPASLWCVLELTLEVSSPWVCHAVSGPCYLEAECWETSPLSRRVRVTPPCLGTKERDGGSSLGGIQRAGPLDNAVKISGVPSTHGDLMMTIQEPRLTPRVVLSPPSLLLRLSSAFPSHPLSHSLSYFSSSVGSCLRLVATPLAYFLW